jgi:hypothetical protein
MIPGYYLIARELGIDGDGRGVADRGGVGILCMGNERPGPA